jgi:peptide/nickel transport system substrate-binding protein
LLLQILQRDWRAVGVELRIRLVSEHQLEATLNGPENGWEAILIGTTQLGMPDGSDGFVTGGGFNSGGYSDARMDALVRASVDGAGTDGLFAYEDYEAEEQPVNILPQGGFPLLVADRLGGVERFVNPQGYWAPEELWVRDEGCGGTVSGGAGR